MSNSRPMLKSRRLSQGRITPLNSSARAFLDFIVTLEQAHDDKKWQLVEKYIMYLDDEFKINAVRDKLSSDHKVLLDGLIKKRRETEEKIDEIFDRYKNNEAHQARSHHIALGLFNIINNNNTAPSSAEAHDSKEQGHGII